MPLPPPRVPRLLMRVWDAPTRLFHWAVVLLLVGDYAAVPPGRAGLHYVCGYALLALLLFRLAWGFVGSDTSRFSAYLRGPFSGLDRSKPDAETGHGAAGGWLVLALLLALGAEAATGLLARGAGATMGATAGAAPVGWPAQAHAILAYAVLALVAAHLAVLVAYAAAGRQGLVQLMVTGKKRLPAATRQPRLSSPLLAALVLAAAAGLVWVLVGFA